MSADSKPAQSGAPEPWQVATRLRWKMVSGVLTDPISLLLLAVGAWALYRGAASLSGEQTAGPLLVSLSSLCAALVFATRYADRLLFGEQDDKFLRVQALGPLGLYRVRCEELSWWLRPLVLLVAAAGLGTSGWFLALLSGAGVALLAPTGIHCALLLRSATPGMNRILPMAALGLAAASLYLWADVPLRADKWSGWLPLLPAGAMLTLALTCRSLAAKSYRHRFAELASKAGEQDRHEPLWPWRVLGRCLPLATPIQARLTRDLILLWRGWNGRGATLLLLSPLSCIYLSDSLSGSMREGAILWRVLESAALGSAAIAYAAGPNLTVLRSSAMAWSRCAPQPGRYELRAAVLYGAFFALVHGGLTLLVVVTTQEGRFAEHLGALCFPVLALELFVVHFSVVYSMAESLGRRIAGEGALILALAFVAAGLAVIAVLYPPGLLGYLLITLGLAARARQRYETLEVTW